MANLYGDDETAQGSSSAPTPAEMAADEKQMHQDDQQTGVLPKTLFPQGVKPGDEYKLRVDQVMDDEVACKIVPDDEAGEPAEAPAESAPEAPMPSGYE